MSLDGWWVHTNMSWLWLVALNEEEVHFLRPWNGSTPKNLAWDISFWCGKLVGSDGIVSFI
jgi:hypothetical protein